MFNGERKPISLIVKVDPEAGEEKARAICKSVRHTLVSACFAFAKVPPGRVFLTGEQIRIVEERILAHLESGGLHQIVGEFTFTSGDRAQMLDEFCKLYGVSAVRV